MNKIVDMGLGMVGIEIHPGGAKRGQWSDENLKKRFGYLFDKKGVTIVAVTAVPNYFVVTNMTELKAVWVHSHDGFTTVMEVRNDTFEKLKTSLTLTRVPVLAPD